MGKKRRKKPKPPKNKPKNNTKKPALPVKPMDKINNNIESAKEIETIHEHARSISNEKERKRLDVNAPPEGIDLQNIWKMADEARQIYEQKIKKVQEQKEKLDEEEKTLDENIKALKIEVEQVAIERQHKENELNDREEYLRPRELDAEAGFSQMRRNSLQKLDVEAKTSIDELSKVREHIAEERAKWREEQKISKEKLNVYLEEQQQSFENSCREIEEELRSERSTEQEDLAKQKQQNEDETKKERKRLKTERKELEAEQEIFQEDQQYLASKIEKKFAGQVEKLKFELQSVREQLKSARKDRDVLQETLSKREKADRRFGHKTPDEVYEEMEALKNYRDQLLQEKANQPGEDAVKRLRALETEQQEWQQQRMKVESERAELKRQLNLSQIGVIEMESLRDHKAALETSRELLMRALEDLREDVNERIKNSQGKSPFPACSKMDENNDLQESLQTTGDFSDLKSFAEDLQHRMAFDPDTGKILYYSIEDIRSFLGGLAMSQLHLLYGISGTGKTSLPLAFARAVGAGNTLVEVQAGWRDRQDLVGHFNVFEKLYYESEFLQAIYTAQCPKYQDALYVIVLDEMNLSHPEQYFADMLSALEQDEQHRQLILMPAPVDSAPKSMDNGRKLSIPPNVWFVGTANHDETTKDFAPKTYDRAHIMELPRQRAKFDINKKIPPRYPISYANLLKAFQNAQNKYYEDAKRAYAYLEENLARIFNEHFQVGWGNRLEIHMEKYVPVVIATGGTIGEATDHILATKILRQIRDRYDNNPDHLRGLIEKIDESWQNLNPEHQAEKSLYILKNELIRLRAYEEDTI